MKKIINGKKYDTDTATELGYWCSTADRRDFSFFSETLYRKRTGEYFLFGTGGPDSRYSVPEGSSGWSGGSRIMPMTYGEARSWAEKHLDGDEYEAAFGEVEEDGSKVAVGWSLPASTAEKIKRRAAEAGITQSEWLARLIDAAD